MKHLTKKIKMPALNWRFGAMAAVPRRQFCGKLNVITPRKCSGSRHCAKPLGRYLQAGESAVDNDNGLESFVL